MIQEADIESNQDDLYEHYKFTADPGQEIIRIDKFLCDRLPNFSRNKIQLAAKNGNLVVNNKNVKQNYKVKPGDVVALVLPYPVREFELIPEKFLRIARVFSDRTVLVAVIIFTSLLLQGLQHNHQNYLCHS